MLKRKPSAQVELFVSGSLEQLVPDDYVVAHVDRVFDLGWLHDEVVGCYCARGERTGIDPEMAVRLMREAQAETAKGDIVRVNATLIRADVSWERLAGACRCRGSGEPRRGSRGRNRHSAWWQAQEGRSDGPRSKHGDRFPQPPPRVFILAARGGRQREERNLEVPAGQGTTSLTSVQAQASLPCQGQGLRGILVRRRLPCWKPQPQDGTNQHRLSRTVFDRVERTGRRGRATAGDEKGSTERPRLGTGWIAPCGATSKA